MMNRFLSMVLHLRSHYLRHPEDGRNAAIEATPQASFEVAQRCMHRSQLGSDYGYAARRRRDTLRRPDATCADRLRADGDSTAAEFGPPPGAKLSVEKLSRIDGFHQRRGRRGENSRRYRADPASRPAGLSRSGSASAMSTKGIADDGGYDLSDPFGHQDHHQRRGDDAGRSRQDRARRSRQQIYSVLCRHEGRRRDARTTPAGRCSTSCRRAGRSRSRICCCILPGSPTASMAKGWSRPPITASISAISTMPASPSGSPRCRWPSSRARCGITGIRSTCSAASSRSRPASRCISSRRPICSIRSA